MRTPRIAEPLAAKVPEVTALFWIIKVLTTGMGEAASDFLAKTNLVLGGLVGAGGFALAMWLQLRTPRYAAPTYWFAVSMVAVFGTMVADLPHKVLGLSYWITSAAYALALVVVFVAWQRREGTLSIHSIVTVRREQFYWLTVLATFATGTAVGDLTGITLGWGFLASGLLFAVAILVPLVAWRLGTNAIVAFWTAYVLTRPLGASFADWLGKEPSIGGGRGYGDGPVALAALVLIVALVAYAARSGRDVQRPVAEPATAAAGLS